MRGFKLDHSGDVVIEHGVLRLTEGDELKRQTIESVLGTNKGEWFLDADEGVAFPEMLRKNPPDDVFRDNIVDALRQCDTELTLEELQLSRSERDQTVRFTARRTDGSTVAGGYTYD